MNIHINHFSLSARNAFESAARLRKETGLSFWTGEWVRDISCHMVPLGNGPHGKDAFIEIQCYVDAHGHLKDTRPNYRYDVLSVDNEYNGDYWTGGSLAFAHLGGSLALTVLGIATFRVLAT